MDFAWYVLYEIGVVVLLFKNSTVQFTLYCKVIPVKYDSLLMTNQCDYIITAYISHLVFNQRPITVLKMLS